tara:strand:+ start:190 stop:291 length:102 start_codon:yes stop_codon:yes gene_type:complete
VHFKKFPEWKIGKNYAEKKKWQNDGIVKSLTRK